MERHRNDESTDIDEVFEELRGKLIQLDRKNTQSEKQSEEIDLLLAEKKEAFLEMEELKFVNQDLESRISILTGTAKQAESQRNDLQDKYGNLKGENETLTEENSKLMEANRKLQAELSELRKNHNEALEKMIIWQNIQQEVSARQTQNHLRMLDIAKKIGHAKATSLYIHQLKEQVGVVYKSAFETIKHLQDTRENMDSDASRPSTSGRNTGQNTSDNVDSSANWRRTESYWKSVNETLRTEMQGYKEELWSGLQTLQQLNGISSTRKLQ